MRSHPSSSFSLKPAATALHSPRHRRSPSLCPPRGWRESRPRSPWPASSLISNQDTSSGELDEAQMKKTIVILRFGENSNCLKSICWWFNGGLFYYFLDMKSWGQCGVIVLEIQVWTTRQKSLETESDYRQEAGWFSEFLFWLMYITRLVALGLMSSKIK